MVPRLWRATCVAVCAILSLHAGWSAEKKDEKKKPEPPSIAVVLPLAFSPGLSNKVTIRGQNLTNVTEFRFANSNLQARVTIKSKEKVEVPKEMDAKKVGDTRLVLELAIPPGTDASTNFFTLISPDGASKPGRFVILASSNLVAEKEPNGSFREAQPIAFGQTIQGTISEAKDVDVFKLNCRAGQTLVAEVQADRYGSSLDAILTLYDERGHQIEANDDSPAGPDSLLRAKIPKDGIYLLSLIDAHDKGGPTYAYLLTIREE